MGTQWFQYQYATIYLTTECALLSKWVFGKFHVQVTWVNNRHLAMPLFFSLQNEFSGTSTEIPYWWCVTSLIWVALLICPAKSKFAFEPIRSTTRIWVVTRQRYRISAVIPQTSSYKATSGWGKEASIQRSLMYSNMAL